MVVYSIWVMTMKPIKTKISITLDEPILEKIQVLAERYDRSVSSCINVILRDYLENPDNARRLPLP